MQMTLPPPRSLFLVFYWTAFACLSLVAAKDPGYGHPRWLPWPAFPWVGIAVVWTMLGAGVFSLHVLFGKPWPYSRRLLVALGIYAALALFFVLTWATDQPALAYVPGWFVLLTFLGLITMGIVHAIHGVARRRGHAP